MAEQQARYLALDVFRGMTICFMIIVNSPGTWDIAYAPLLHASWHGFTPTDLVFPSFLFAVGNAMAFAMHKYETQGSGVFWRKTIKRTLLIFLLGYLMYWFPFFDSDWSLLPIAKTRILGVLQRIALCYFFASVLIHYCSRNTVYIVSAMLLVGYWIVMYLYGDAGDPYSLTGNAALKLDLAVMGPDHLYHGEGIAFDPEGMLSTLPAIVNVVIGYYAGLFIRKTGNTYEALAKLLLAGGVFIFVALTWDMVFPINKKLWTSSFVLLTTGLDLMILPAIMYVTDMMGRTRWTYFFVVFGRNPLFIYLVSELLLIALYMVGWQRPIYEFYTGFMSPINASLAFALSLMFVCWLTGYVLDRRKIYIKV